MKQLHSIGLSFKIIGTYSGFKSEITVDIITITTHFTSSIIVTALEPDKINSGNGFINMKENLRCFCYNE